MNESRRRAGRRLPTSRTAALAYLVFFLGTTYTLPFLGLLLSLLIPVLTSTPALWPDVPTRTKRIWSVVAWAGLWLPALVDLFTPLLYDAGITISTSWLVIPLCGPDDRATLLVPAACAMATCLVGLAIAARRRRPWAWVVACWLAPWAHQAASSLVSSSFSC